MSYISDATVIQLLEEITDYHLIDIPDLLVKIMQERMERNGWEDKDSAESTINEVLQAEGYQYDVDKCQWYLPPPDGKYYKYRHIQDIYDKLTSKEKVSILWEALDYMQQFNGRTPFYCVALALGYENFEGENDTYTKK